MFLKTDINEEYIEEFNKLGITNTDDILTILSGFDMLAEIGYTYYKENND